MAEEPSRPSRARKWQGSGVRVSPSQQVASSKRAKIIGVAVVMLLLLGAIAAWVFFPHPAPRPFTLAIWVNDYPDRRIPVNPWAEQDRTAWLSLPLKDKNAFTSQQRNLLVKELSNLENKTGDEPVLVYLSAFALTDPDGKVFLLPNNATLDNSGSWLALDEVLKYLRLCPANHKLLILDVFHPFTDPAGGVLAHDVAQRLEPSLKDAVKDDPRLQIFTACAPGEVSYPAEDMGHSVFAYYLLQGLHGQADGHNAEQKKDALVSQRELAAYVTAEVERWARVNRRVRQTPTLYGDGADFPLTNVEATPTTVAMAPLETGYPDWLRKHWELRERWWLDGSFRAAPGPFRALETSLLRAEQRWRGGGERERIEKDLLDRIGRLEQERKEALRNVDWPTPNSLALAVAVEGAKPPEITRDLRSALRDLTEVFARVQQPKPEERDRAKLESLTTEFLKKFEKKPFELSWTLFYALVQDINLPRPEQLQLAAELLRKGAADTSYKETILLKRLAELKPANPKDWPAEAVQTALQVIDETEKARAAHPAAVPWVGDLRREAERLREKALGLLMSDDPAAWSKAREPLGQALKAYREINDLLNLVQAAQRSRDEALVLLPGYLPYLEQEPDLEKTWQEALRTGLELQELLVLPDTAAAVGQALTENRGKLASLTELWGLALNKLRQPFASGPLKQLMDQSRPPAPADWWNMKSLLAVPWLDARDRAALCAAWRSQGNRLQQLSASAAPAPEGDRTPDAREERRRALRRARCSAALLRLAQASEDRTLLSEQEKKARSEALRKLDKTLAEVERDPMAPPSWSALERQLRQAWVPYRVGRFPIQ